MRKPRVLPGNKTRVTFSSLVCNDLGYCCEWAFFRLFKQTSFIAARLGVSRRTVCYHKARFKTGELTCQGCPTCLKKRPR